VELRDSNNKKLADGAKIGTGTKVVITATNKGDTEDKDDDKTVVATYTIIMMGDITGNGIADTSDCAQLQWNALHKVSYTDGSPKKIAADITGNGEVNASDAAQIMWNHMGGWSKNTYTTPLK
jgi:hypothetical protein